MSEAPEQVAVEATGETVGEAKWTALRELEKLQPGIDKAAVQFEIVSEGERGLLGVGYAPARVVATAPVSESSAPVDESPRAARVRKLLERISAALGVQVRLDLTEDEDSITASFSGRDLGLVIGKHGQTIDAIQYVVNAIVFRDAGEERKSVVVDAAGYRARRRAALDAIAVRAAERALAGGGRVELEPMTAVERKVVHERLKDYGGVRTSSEGTEPNRYVVIEAE